MASNYGVLRLGAAEQPSDADCRPVTYEQCRLASIEVGTALSVSTNIDISLAGCDEGVATTPCFVGCSLGASNGAPALYLFLTPEDEVRLQNFNSYRCAAAPHEFCLCASDPVSPPPPPTIADEREFQYAGSGTPDTSQGHATAFYKLVATDAALPEAFRGNTINYDCPGEETGAGHCARHCAGELGDNLVAFSVTGLVSPPPPPVPNPPPASPSPPPNPLPPWGFQFNGATDGCKTAGIYFGSECRDGGKNSLFPPYCDLGSQHQACGPREYINNGDPLDADDSCELANDGVCHDGGPGSVFYEDADGKQQAACRYGTDKVRHPHSNPTPVLS